MTNLDKFLFSTENFITKNELEKLSSASVDLSFLLVRRLNDGDWVVKVYTLGKPLGYFMTARRKLKSFVSLDTAVRQLRLVCPRCIISIHTRSLD